MPTNHVHTARQLIEALEAFIAAHPEEEHRAVGFTVDRGEALADGKGAIWFVCNVIEDPDSGAALLTRGF